MEYETIITQPLSARGRAIGLVVLIALLAVFLLGSAVALVGVLVAGWQMEVMLLPLLIVVAVLVLPVSFLPLWMP